MISPNHPGSSPAHTSALAWSAVTCSIPNRECSSREIIIKAIASIALLSGLVCSAQAQNAPTLAAAGDSVVSTIIIKSFQINSAILGETRQIRVHLPASHTRTGSARRYPVIVVVDGAWLLSKVAAASVELAANGLIPESIIVAIENTDEFRGRVRDLTPPGLSVSGSSLNERGDQFLDFIERELLPAVDQQFRGDRPRVFVGTSSGGVLATWVAATRPNFAAVISLDAPISLQDSWLAKQLLRRATTAQSPLRYMTYDARFGWPDEHWNALQAAAPASWKLHREKLPLEGHETMQFVGAYLGLREVFSDYSRMAAPEFPTTSILPHYAKVTAAWNAPLVPPRRVLQNVTDDLLMEGRGAAAREAFNTLVTGYGLPPDSVRTLTRIADAEKLPPPTETVESLLATPFPTPAEARAYIGDWVGESRMGDAPPVPRILHIRIENGRVVADTENPNAPPEFRRIPWEYFKVTAKGISWGHMNGMRPRGMILS
ncbi:MAG: alpha/beta hydrolase, partial [Longimicrobiales bacterium]